MCICKQQAHSKGLLNEQMNETWSKMIGWLLGHLGNSNSLFITTCRQLSYQPMHTLMALLGNYPRI